MDLLEPFAWSTVAVVDDSTANAMLTCKILERAGLRSVHRITESALVDQWTRDNDPDLLLMDLHMPGLDGYEVLTVIRQRCSPTDLPVIVLTGDVTREASRRALALGANDFLIKPLDAAELVHRVRNLLDVRAAHRALHRQHRWLEAAGQIVRRIDAGQDADVHHELFDLTRTLAEADLVCLITPPVADTICLPPVTGSVTATLDPDLVRRSSDDPRPVVLDVEGESCPVLTLVPARPIGSALLIPVPRRVGGTVHVMLTRKPGRPQFTEADAEDASQFLNRATAALELAAQREEHRQYLAFFEVLVTQVTDCAIIGLDVDGRITSWNAGASRFLRADADRAQGKDVSVLWSSQDTEDGLPMRLLAQARAAEQADYEGWMMRADNDRFWGEVSITALHDDRGTLLGYALVIRDLSELRRLEDARESFFASVSHDIRAPLTAIQGFVEMIPVAGPARQDEFIQRVRNNVSRLGVMVDNMLDHARLRAGDLPVQPVELDLGALAETCARDLSPVLSEHTVVLPEHGVVVLADHSATSRVLANLLLNSAKYSPVGSRIECRTERIASGGLLTVSDQGRGIATADLTSIFDEFERGSLAEQDGGSGLGLSSVYRLVALQGGEVSISSEVGRGTTVSVVLPYAPESAAVTG